MLKNIQISKLGIQTSKIVSWRDILELTFILLCMHLSIADFEFFELMKAKSWSIFPLLDK